MTGLREGHIRDLDPQSWNRYPYTGNNPILYVDPDGEARYVLLVGDPGLGDHNAGRNLERAAETRRAELGAAGHSATVQRVSSVKEMNSAITTGPKIDGGVEYFGHGWQGELYPGELPGAGTNLTSKNVGDLSGKNLAPGAQVVLNACMSGDGGAASIAQLVANQLGVPTLGSSKPMSYTNTPGVPIEGDKARPAETGPLYMTPDRGGSMIRFEPAPRPAQPTPSQREQRNQR